MSAYSGDVVACAVTCLKQRLEDFPQMKNLSLTKVREKGLRNRGQGLVEYALIIALVAIVVIGALILLGPQIATIFDNINSAL